MATAIYKLSKKTNENGLAEILVRITISRKNKIQLHSNIYVEPQYFEASAVDNGYKVGVIKVPSFRSSRFASAVEDERKAEITRIVKGAKESLDAYTRTMIAICDCVENKDIFDKGTLLDMYELMKDVNPKTITLDSINKKHEEREREFERKTFKKSIYDLIVDWTKTNGNAENRNRHLICTMRVLARFEYFRRNVLHESFTADIDTLTKGDIIRFMDYYKNEYMYYSQYPEEFEKMLSLYPAEKSDKHKNAVIRQRSQNTLVTNIKRLKAFFNAMVKNGITTNEPFNGVEIGEEEYGTPFMLRSEEVDIITNFDLSAYPSLAEQRDIFIFQCHVGCRVSDLYRLTTDNIVNGCLNYIPNKTKKRQQRVEDLRLTPIATTILERYADKVEEGKLLPLISQQNYNYAIKEILKKCGITRKVAKLNPITKQEEMIPICDIASSHMARRTFTDEAYHINNDPAAVASLTGHSQNTKQFARYRRVDERDKNGIMSKMFADTAPKKDIQGIINSLTEAEKAELLKQLLAN